MTPKFKTRDVEKSLYNEAATLFKSIKADDEDITANANRIAKILGIKTMAEYEERLIFRSEAGKILKDCERFLEYVKGRLP